VRVEQPAGAGAGGRVRAQLGGEGERVVLEVAARLAAARGDQLVVAGQAGRRLAATVDGLRAAGLVADDDGRVGVAVGVEVRAGAPGRVRAEMTTLWVQPGRDDDARRLTALVDRLRGNRTEDPA
jgi:hypothetical protein